MQSRVVGLEEGKDPATNARPSQSRVFPSRILQFLSAFLVVAIAFTILSVYMIRYFGVQRVVPAIQSTIQACYGEPGTLEGWIRPPLNLLHSMNDTDLFWRASFVPQKKDYAFERTPKIAFMFLARGPLPMAPLWERFFEGQEGLYSIYIHSMPDYEPTFSSSSVFYKRQIPSQVAEWGMMSMCDAERRLLANALLDISNEWFILISEACIPLYNFSFVYDYISRSRHSFMGSYDELGPDGRGRYSPNMAPEVNITEWRKGSQWFEINRKLAVDIIEDNIFYPKFEHFCRPNCYVDEHYFPTMLSIQSPHLLANRTLTWVDWSRGGAHPATYGRSDIGEQFFKRMFQGRNCTYNDQPSSVCFLFARKFSPNALEPLLEVSSNVFGY
ncbi:glycosyltransferase BC10-like [Diospyros lotus]|uniref:glycosyltransferase BC10-like n=1 Tax=Diospyros lotus TaxID=55363 RepID=UPI0022504AE3|nr:glycosyltransferase BC10-like [Diospyros lotus]